MGNNNSHQGVHNHPKERTHSNRSSSSAKQLSAQSSVQSAGESPSVAQLPSIEKLAKILVQKCLEEEKLDGITIRTFTKYVFPRYHDLSERLFLYFVTTCGSMKQNYMSISEFTQATERFLGVITDDVQIEMYLKMYSDDGTLRPDGFCELLLAAHKLAVDHYSEGPANCPLIYRTAKAVVDSAFHRKQTLSVPYMTHWIQSNCPRLTVAMHRYIVHVLSTAYRHVGVQDDDPAGLELSTPVLEREPSFPTDEGLLPLSQVWLLAITLPELYTRPSKHHSPTNASNGLTSQNFVAKLLGSVCPSHWVELYDSSQHGLGSNRFMHHVLSYRGPTLVVIRGEQGMEFCIAACTEWKQSHQFWGGENCMALELLPHFHVLERGPKLLYFNDSIRGYPKGLRVGTDPRHPVLEVNADFSQVQYREAPYPLIGVEVWGCGTEHEREAQLDVKKWEVKNAEKARQVKIRAEDWIDHPDRYLLELAGRQTYSEHK